MKRFPIGIEKLTPISSKKLFGNWMCAIQYCPENVVVLAAIHSSNCPRMPLVGRPIESITFEIDKIGIEE
ncbi:hypothetical protein QR98_0027240 [Sarcoptes scabiei]|uniref:Uncharacterized protein n=1 Tax=Sarcoptes scabiei TaxID=52283 RepID=A0A132A066_SARSC|nr:hypothetical protein QR98_0027240 [Sarcoptes scabiei]